MNPKPAFRELLEAYKEISLIQSINAILGWDMNVNLPSDAAESRAEQTAYITKIATEKWQDPTFIELIRKAEEKAETVEEKAIIRNLNHSLKYYTRIPKDLIVEFSKTTSIAFMVWSKARATNDFSEFLPHLKKIIKLNQMVADHLGYKNNPYDALLDLYEPNFTAEMGTQIFADIQPLLTDLIKKITGHKNYIKDFTFIGNSANYEIDKQRQLSHYILKKIGYSFGKGRLDVSPHPFTTALGEHDVRVTTAYKVNDFRDALAASIHEGGHALYEQGVNPSYALTPLGGGVSLGIHESQSRFWENQIGRHPEFIKFIAPLLHAFFPPLIADHDEITRAFNHVKPGFIRIEADEVTYNLHIALRFELENDLINNKLDPQYLPEAWNEKMKSYLGIIPPTDAQGVLQDVHWSYGNFGYFPTYTLGNLYAAQLRNSMLKEKEYEKDLSRGDVGFPLAWLRDHIHQYGSLYWPDELIKKATGEKLNTQYYKDYITQKYSQIYDL